MAGDIDQAQRQLAGELLGRPGITGVAVGEHAGAPCLTVWVVELTAELRETIPQAFAGFPVRVETSGPIRAV